MLSAHFGAARPVGLPKLAQETPSNQPVLKNKLIKFKIEERLTRFRKYQSIQHKLQNKRQTDQTELGAPNHPQNPTLSAWNYNAPFKVGTINCRGLKGDSALTKKANLISAMEKLNIHIILLQETHVNTNSLEKVNGFTFLYSTSITDEQRKRADNKRAQTAQQKREGKGKGKGKEQNQGCRQIPEDIEHGGVGFLLSPVAITALRDFEQIDGRLMTLTLDAHGPDIHIINAYAPQSGCDATMKEVFYNKLRICLENFPSSHPTFIIGDFNARLHARLPDEHRFIGPHVFGRGLTYLQQMNDATFENRSMFVEFCIDNDLWVANSFFQKPPSSQITFREAGVDHAPPWTPEKFAQLDFIIAPQRWKNCVKDAASQSTFCFDSDHYLVVARIEVKLKIPEARKRPVLKFRQPDGVQLQIYNRHVTQNSLNHNGLTMKNFISIIAQASRSAFNPVPAMQRRCYISQHTWALIEQRQAAHTECNSQTVKDLTRRIKCEARKDKRKFLLESLKESVDSRSQWKAIKNLKKKSTPNFTKLKDKDGNRVGPHRRAEAIAEYLSDVQWKEPVLPPPQPFRRAVIADPAPCPTDNIQLHELNNVIKKAKAHKAPGPDETGAELFKLLDQTNRDLLLGLLNHWWRTEQIHEEHLMAQVVTIFKKGSTEQISNYRPISLLNTVYKLFAAIVRKRLADHIDPFISESQFGFRRDRSTTQALFVARRLQDIGEQTGDRVVMLFLDWEKAFDKLCHSRMFEALMRLNIPEKLRNVIAALYKKPTFCVKYDQRTSNIKDQQAGIRQGCPLSPYLFILVMSVLFSDIHYAIDRDIILSRLDRINFSEILYADDTLLVSKDTSGMNRLLHAIELESSYYGLKLNQDKCAVLSLNGNSHVRFRDGSLVPHVDEVTYLGGTLTSQVSVAREISSRISSTMATWKSMDIFWRHAQCSVRNRLQVFNSVIKSKLLYGLETLEIPSAQMSRLEAFHLKGLRKILGMQTTFVNRANTNQEVFRRANIAIQTRQNPTCTIQKISELLGQRRIALVGHILRQPRTNPLRNVCFRQDTAAPFEVLYRRPGRPRRRWIDSTLNIVWEKIRPNGEGFNQSPEQLAHIQNAARNYQL